MPHAVIKSVLLFTNSYTCELAIRYNLAIDYLTVVEVVFVLECD